MPPLARGEDRCVRAHRGGLRLGRRRPADDRGSRRRRLADLRHEAVHLDRAPGGHVHLLRPHGPGDRRATRYLGVHPRPRARRGDPGGGEAGAQLLVDSRAPDRDPRRRRPAPARRAARLRRRDGDPGRRPDRDRRASARDRAGGATSPASTRRSGGRSGNGSASTRRSGGSSPTCRPRSMRAAARLPGRVAEGARRAAHRGRCEGEALRLRDARRQTSEAIQILGGYGYTKEFPSSATTATRR